MNPVLNSISQIYILQPGVTEVYDASVDNWTTMSLPFRLDDMKRIKLHQKTLKT